MGKFVPTAVLDAPLDLIATATEMYFCAGQPASRTAAIAAAAAAAITMAPGDFVKSNSGGGRVLTVAAKTTTANAAINADHVVLCTGSTLLYCTTAPVQATNSGSSVGAGAFTITNPALA